MKTKARLHYEKHLEKRGYKIDGNKAIIETPYFGTITHEIFEIRHEGNKSEFWIKEISREFPNGRPKEVIEPDQEDIER